MAESGLGALDRAEMGCLLACLFGDPFRLAHSLSVGRRKKTCSTMLHQPASARFNLTPRRPRALLDSFVLHRITLREFRRVRFARARTLVAVRPQ